MDRNRAASGFPPAKKMFPLCAAVGALLGLAAFAALFWPFEYGDGAADEFFSGLAAGSWEFALISALCGLAMGILCSSAMSAAIEIQAARGRSHTPARQSTAAGLGAFAAGLLPAAVIFSLGLGQQHLLPFALAALGFEVLCFAAGYSIAAVLSRRRWASNGWGSREEEQI